MKALFPDVKSVAVSRMIEINTENMQTDTVEVALLNFIQKPSSKEIDKIDLWLKARLKTDKLKLITD